MSRLRMAFLLSRRAAAVPHVWDVMEVFSKVGPRGGGRDASCWLPPDKQVFKSEIDQIRAASKSLTPLRNRITRLARSCNERLN
jgi:hypothetical protein